MPQTHCVWTVLLLWNLYEAQDAQLSQTLGQVKGCEWAVSWAVGLTVIQIPELFPRNQNILEEQPQLLGFSPVQ